MSRLTRWETRACDAVQGLCFDTLEIMSWVQWRGIGLIEAGCDYTVLFVSIMYPFAAPMPSVCIRLFVIYGFSGPTYPSFEARYGETARSTKELVSEEIIA